MQEGCDKEWTLCHGVKSTIQRNYYDYTLCGRVLWGALCPLAPRLSEGFATNSGKEQPVQESSGALSLLKSR
ncbi:hypothetical protein TNCV_615561 [Trichonephila clavipes]|nr:hypothetical protein TNCV_615561 [Trichonephila clavipes]